MTSPGLVGYVLAQERYRVLEMGGLLAMVGILEGLGVATLLPVLDAVLSVQASQRTGVAEAIDGVLRAVGLEPSLGGLLTGLVVVFTLKATVFYFAGLRVAGLAARVAMELRQRLLRAITHASWSHVLHYPSGFIANALSSEADRTGSAIYTLAQVTGDAVLVLAYLALAFMVSWPTALACVVVGSLILTVLRGRVATSREAAAEQVSILRSVIARITDSLPSLKPLKAMASEEYLLPRLEAQTRAYYDAQYRGIAATELLSKAREPLLVAALALGLWLVAGVFSLASTSALVLAFVFYRTVTSLTHMQLRWATVAAGESAFRSLMGHIDAAEHAAEVGHPQGGAPVGVAESESVPSSDVVAHVARRPYRVRRLERELRLENVSFEYDGRPVIRSVDFVMTARSLVVVTGPSGVGKTTLVDLVAGLLRPSAGRILIDGYDLAGVEMQDWRRSLGYVPQEPMLFADTVRMNITLGESVVDEDIERALRGASAAGFVHDLPLGLEHRLGDGGAGLSGGERHRLAIARALARRPSLLIFDEPTASLDHRAAEEVRSTISALRGELSLLVVTHEPDMMALADGAWQLAGTSSEDFPEGEPPTA